ncbi:FAD-dependent oxidoreductase [Actinokineospora sp. NPDC004072]
MARVASPWLLDGGSSPRPGRDRRAVLHPAHPGGDRADGDAPRVAVVGGGIAGVTAAVALAERGVRVRLFERHAELGGRLRGWTTGHGATMTRGFHAFFRQYYNLRGLLRRVDPDLSMLAPIGDYPLRHIDGAQDTFVGLPRTPPWNAAGFMARSSTFSARDLMGMNTRAASALFDVNLPRVYHELDSVDADTFLRELRFPASARHLAFEVFSRSFFAHPGALSAAELATMFHIYFLGSSEGLLFDVPDDPYPHTLWNPLHAYLLSLGAEVHTGTAVERIGRTDAGYRVRAGAEHSADGVVLATDVSGLRALVAASPELGDPRWRRRVAGLACAPPFLVTRLWLDRPARPDRPAFLGTSGYRLLDNISLVDLFEGEAGRWRARTGGSVVELHAYALPGHTDPDHCAQALIKELHTVYPELRAAQVLHQQHVMEADCPLFAPGTFAERPTVSTPDPTLVVAGDLVRVDLPVALMERAATSGFLAANTLLARWDLHGHDLWTVPNRGRWALLRRRPGRRPAVPATANG